MCSVYMKRTTRWMREAEKYATRMEALQPQIKSRSGNGMTYDKNIDTTYKQLDIVGDN